MSIIIKNIQTLVTMDNGSGIKKKVDVLIEGNVISKIGRNINAPQGAKVIDGTNKVVYPGFINTHHHFYQSLTRNIPAIQNVKLFDWLLLLYEIWRELDEDFVKTSTQIAAGELLLSGCTTSTDQYYVFPRKASNRLIDIEIDTVAEMGMRFYPNRGSMSCGKSQGGLPPDDVVQTPDEIMEDCERVISKYHDPNPLSMCRIILAPCSPFSVTTDLLKLTSRYAKEKGLLIHTHLCETQDEENYCLEKFGKRPLAYMDECGWLGNNVHFAHGIFFNDDEIKILAETGTGVSHCPASNMRLGSGICRVPDMLKAGVKVGLSVDGSASNDSGNYVREMELALLLHRIGSGVDSITPEDVLHISTLGGAQILNTPEIGCIKEGNAADLAIFNLKKLEYAGTMSDPASSIIMCGSGTRTEYTIVNGKLVVEDGKLVNIDESELYERANKITARLLETTSKNTGIDYYKK